MAEVTKKRKFRGVVVVKPEWCKGCEICVTFCPTGAIVMSKEFNEKGYQYPELAYPEKCSACRLCGLY